MVCPRLGAGAEAAEFRVCRDAESDAQVSVTEADDCGFSGQSRACAIPATARSASTCLDRVIRQCARVQPERLEAVRWLEACQSVLGRASDGMDSLSG